MKNYPTSFLAPDLRNCSFQQFASVLFGRPALLLCTIGFAFGAAICTMGAQEDPPQVSTPSRMQRRTDQAERRSFMLHSEVKLVLVPVTVTDLLQHPVMRLSKQNFRVFDNGVEQEVSAFFSEEAPVSIGMVVDASNSMRNKIDESRLALAEFLRLSTPGDEFSLLKFSDRPDPVHPFTTNVSEIEDDLALIQTGGWTSLYDALYLSIRQMKHAAYGTKALFVLSDGGDNNSHYTESEIRGAVREADVRIFAISIFDHAAALERIAEESGGRAYQVHKLAELPGMAAKLSAEIHSRYVVGYLPERGENDGKFHKVTVKLVPPPGSPRLRVAWRHGYYAPLR